MAQKPLPKFLQQTIYATPAWITIRGSLEHGQPQAVAVVDALIEKGVGAAVEVWNEHFSRMQAPLHELREWEVGGRKIVAERWLPLEPGVELGLALKALLKSDRPERVRRCPVCQTVFFDPTKRGTKTYDTLRCGFLVRKRRSRAKKS